MALLGSGFVPFASAEENGVQVAFQVYTDGQQPRHWQALIHREMVRQAFVLSGLHYAEMTPMDAVMDRISPRETFAGVELDVNAELTRDGEFLLEVTPRNEDGATAFRRELGEYRKERLIHMINDLAALIPEEIAGYLTELAPDAVRPERKWAVPELDADAVLWRMNPMDQFRLLRYWHARADHEGLTREVLTSLSMGYANLGQLTAHFWNSFSVSAGARSLLYAGLLRNLHGEDDASLETYAYALMLRTHFMQAQNTIRRIEGEPSPLIQSLEHFYRFDLPALREEAVSDLPHAQLSAFLGMLSVERFQMPNYITPIIDELIVHTLGNVRAMDISNQEVGVRRLHSATRRGFQMNQDLLESAFKTIPDLPESLLKFLQPAFDQSEWERQVTQAMLLRSMGLSPARPVQKPSFSGETYRRLYEAAAEEPFAEDGYPDWRFFTRMFWDNHFYNAALRVDFMATRWNVNTADYLDEIREEFTGHPLANILFAYDNRINNDESGQRLRQVHIGEAMPVMHRFLDRYARHRTDRFADRRLQQIQRDYFIGTDNTLIDILEMRRYRGQQSTDQIAPHIVMQAPYNPRGLADMIFYSDEWETHKEKGLRKHPEHPLIMGAIAWRLNREGRSAEAIPYFEASIHEMGSRPYFNQLAAIYLEQGDEDKWLETRLKFNEVADTGLARARNYEEIAYYFMEDRRPERGLEFAENAAGSYSAWGLQAAALNHKLLGNREEAESYLQRVVDRYDQHRARYAIRGWVQLGLGDREQILARLEQTSLRDPNHSQFRTALGDFEKAAEDLLERYKQRKDNYDLLLAALNHLMLDNQERAETLLDQTIREIDIVQPDDVSRRANAELAQLFLNALQNGLESEELIKASEALRTDSLPGNLKYNRDFRFFTGFFLYGLGEQELAREIFLDIIPLKFNRLSDRLAAGMLRHMGADPLERFRPEN